MTRDARQSGEEVQDLRTLLADALLLAARVPPTPPQQPKDQGQGFPDSPDLSQSYRGPMIGRIAQIQMVIPYKPARFPNEQSKMR